LAARKLAKTMQIVVISLLVSDTSLHTSSLSLQLGPKLCQASERTVLMPAMETRCVILSFMFCILARWSKRAIY